MRTILVVDDQHINRKILVKILLSKYNVIEAENGKIALDILDGNSNISAVILDVMMPVMDGYEVLKTMRSSTKLADIPVIVSTHEDGDLSEIKALELGASDFVNKPYNPDVLLIRLKNLIQMNEARAAVNILEKDTLTGLLSKEGFYHRVELILRDKREQYAIIAGDVERFKIVNDTLGEEKADMLLRYIADCLREKFSVHDSVLSRNYADQFLIFTKYFDGLDKVLKDIVKSVKSFIKTDKIFMNFAIYNVGEEDISIRSMCDRAVLAAGTIKGEYNKNVCFYDDELRARMIREQLITNIMNDALNNNEFQVYYQPKFDANTEHIAGAEALVRWISPDYGFMSPGDFIPLFEKNGFITQLDMYVWESVCKYIKKIRDKHKGECIPISVNVSRKDIYNKDLPEHFTNLIKKYDLEPKYLHLEITETAYTDNPYQLIEAVEKLKSIGFVIEMDDFGSGYSSLNMLSELPINVLKLDMKFIQNEQAHNRSSNIISSVINLAKWMNLLVVAEGVETKEQLDYLRNLNCNLIQGYYFAKPMPAEEFERLLIAKPVTPVYDVNSYIVNKMDNGNEKNYSNIMLVVDDLALNRVILTDYFKTSFNVEQMENGAAAWSFIQDYYKYISVIMLDLYMPGMDGFTLLKNIKEDTRFAGIPVIITSQAEECQKEEVIVKYADGFIAKPYEKEVAVQVVYDVLNKTM